MSKSYNKEYLNFIKSLIKSFKLMSTQDVTVKSKEAGYTDKNSRRYLRKLERDGFVSNKYDYSNGSTVVNKWIYVED